MHKNFCCIPMGFHVIRTVQIWFLFHIAANLHKTTPCQRSIEKEYPQLSERLLKYSPLCQLHICVRLDFVHTLQLKQCMVMD